MTSLIPTPDSIPTSWGYFQFFLLLTFPLHLLFMNSLLGSTCIAIYAHFKGSQQSKVLAYELAKVIPLLVALAVNMGVAPLLFLQVLYGHLIYSSSVLMGLFWIMIIPVLLLSYYATYWYDFKFSSLGRAGILVLFFACCGFLFIGFLFSNNMTLMLHPENWDVYLNNSFGTVLNTGDSTLWPRYLHFIIGGTGVGGLFVALYGKFLARKNRSLGDYASALGLKFFIALTLIQIGIGVWFLLAVPRVQMLMFMGHNMLATTCFLLALLLIVALLITAFRKKIYATSILLLALVYAMVFIRDFVRGGFLQEHFAPEMLTVSPEYSPMVFFLVTLVIGLALVVWMVRVAFTRCAD